MDSPNESFSLGLGPSLLTGLVFLQSVFLGFGSIDAKFEVISTKIYNRLAHLLQSVTDMVTEMVTSHH